MASTSDDLCLYFMVGGGSSIHQRYITISGHTDRPLRQLKKVKQHPKLSKEKII